LEPELSVEQTKQAYPWLGGAAEKIVERGWNFMPYWVRENPTHTEELRTRVDALAHYNATQPRYKRMRDPWSKAFSQVCMMLQKPDWWNAHQAVRVSIIDPPTLPPVVSESVFLKAGYLPMCWGEHSHYQKLWDTTLP
jgi:hypothetical protein